MGISIQDLLSGDIVKPRQQVQQAEGLGSLLAYISQGQLQSPQLPSMPNYAEIYKPNSQEKYLKEKQQNELDALAKMQELIGNKSSPGNGIPTPYRDAILPTKGSGYLGNEIDRNELAIKMMGLNNSNLQQAGMNIFERLIPTATKAGVGVIPADYKHQKDPDTNTWWWVGPNGDRVRDVTAMTELQKLTQDPTQVEAIQAAKVAPQVRDVILPSGATVPMTNKEAILQQKSTDTIWDSYSKGEIDAPTRDKMISESTRPIGQSTYEKEQDIKRASNDEAARVAALDLPVMKNDIQNMRVEVTKAIEDLKIGGGQKQILPGVNRWFDANVINDPSANRAIRIQGSKVLESLKAIGGNDSNADLQFAQLTSGLDPYYTDKDTLQKNYENLLTGLDYKEKVLEDKYGAYTPDAITAPKIKSNAPVENKSTGKVTKINGVYYKSYDDYKARRK